MAAFCTRPPTGDGSHNSACALTRNLTVTSGPQISAQPLSHTGWVKLYVFEVITIKSNKDGCGGGGAGGHCKEEAGAAKD